MVNEILTKFRKKRYSQNNEELIIRDFFQDRKGGFFVDIGAAWPAKDSTTFYLERHLGWAGIAVDALSIYESAWKRRRPHSKFLNYAVADRSGETVAFYQHAISSLSSLSKDHSSRWGGENNLTPLQVQTITLNDLLDENNVTKIDFLSMDIEGGEPEALKKFDIKRFRPDFVCIEKGPPKGPRPSLLRYFDNHGYERIEKYIPYDRVNWYFKPQQAVPAVGSIFGSVTGEVEIPTSAPSALQGRYAGEVEVRYNRKNPNHSR